MRHIDLFSGIGGFALAASWVWGKEYNNIGHSEVEPYPCKIYHRHFQGSACLGDITKINWTEEMFRNIDLLTGGFPCQPHSVAGKRKASADERDLWGECARALSILRPRYALFENVPGLLVSERGRFFNRVISDLAKIGYDAEWYTIGAWQVGAHHKRDRIWIVAYPSENAMHGRLIHVGDEISGSERNKRNTGARSGGRIRGESERVADNADVANSSDRVRQREASGRSGHTSLSSEDVAHADKAGRRKQRGSEPVQQEQRTAQGGGQDVENPNGRRREQCESIEEPQTGIGFDRERLPDWAGGNIGQPWPVTEFERPSGEDVSDTNRGGCSPIIITGSGTEALGGGENWSLPLH